MKGRCGSKQKQARTSWRLPDGTENLPWPAWNLIWSGKLLGDTKKKTDAKKKPKKSGAIGSTKKKSGVIWKLYSETKKKSGVYWMLTGETKQPGNKKQPGVNWKLIGGKKKQTGVSWKLTAFPLHRLPLVPGLAMMWRQTRTGS
jgi:hypothetical protein